MIILAGLKFAENNNEFLESLFHSGSTCSGYAKRLKRQVNLYDMQHNIIGAINKDLVLCGAIKQPKINNSIWYSYNIPEIFKSINKEDLLISMLALSIGHDSKGYFFK